MNRAIVTGCPGSGWKVILPLLRSLLPDRLDLRPIEHFSPEMDPPSGVVFLLFHTQARRALSHALFHGLEPRAFLADWQTTNRRLLAFQRRQRRHALLIDAERACAHPEALIEACRGFDLIGEPAPEGIAELAACQPPTPRPIEDWLADQFLAREPDIQRLEHELEASGLPLAPLAATEPPDPETIWSLYRNHLEQINQLARARNEQASLAAERQKQIETLTAEKAALTAARDDQARLAAERQEQLATLQAEKVDLSEESELLLLQLHQVQEELESFFLQNQALVPELEANLLARERLEKTLVELAEAHDAQIEQLAQAEERRRERELAFATERQVNRLAREQLTVRIVQLSETMDRLQNRIRDLEAQLADARKQSPLDHSSQPSPPKSPVIAIKPPLRPISRKQYKHDRRLLTTSPLFDASWYARTYLTELPGVDPVDHYLTIGVYHGYHPSPAFDAQYYLQTNPDVLESGLNPLVHYLRFGRVEGRDSRPVED